MFYFLYNSLLVCVLILGVYFLTPKENNQTTKALKILLLLFVSGILGARLFHIFYEDFPYYKENPWHMIQFWRGGFVYYGGLITAILSAYLYIKIKKESFWKWADFFTFYASLTYALGRIGCFISGCCYGKFFIFPWGYHRHPTQIYASIIECIILYVLIKTHTKSDRSGTLFLCWLIYHATARVFLEPFRGDFRGQDLMGLSISTFISLCIIVTALGFLIYRNYFQRLNIKN